MGTIRPKVGDEVESSCWSYEPGGTPPKLPVKCRVVEKLGNSFYVVEATETGQRMTTWGANLHYLEGSRKSG